jgi:lysozyme
LARSTPPAGTEDTGYLNPNFEYDWAGAKRIKLARIAYHYARPEGADADDEAAWMLDQIDAHGGLEVGDLLWLDLEAGSGDLGGWSLEFLRHTQERAGFKPIVYSGAWFTSQHNLAAYPALADYGLSLAAYQDEMPAPPPPWPLVAFWQYSDKGRIPGINGDVDLDVFNGRADRIRLYGKPGAAGPTVTVPVQPLPDELAAARAQIAERDALITSLRSDLADRNSRLGAAGVDYAGQLRQIADRLAELKPTG